MLENFNWLIFIAVAGLSTIVGAVEVVQLCVTRDRRVDGRVRLGRRMVTLAIVVKCCELVLYLRHPDRIGQWAWDQAFKGVALTGFWTAVAALITARAAIGSSTTELSRQIKAATWILLGISALGGCLFVISEVTK